VSNKSGRKPRQAASRSKSGRDQKAKPSGGRDPVRAGARSPVDKRQDRKETLRRKREAEERLQRRSAFFKRMLVIAVVWLAALLVFAYIRRPNPVRPIPAADVAAAQAAGCTGVVTPTPEANVVRTHLQPNQNHTYTQHPATSGPHDPNPLGFGVHVFTAPVPETRAVHNLEHAGIMIYYRPDGPDALPAAVVSALASVANASKTAVLAPYRDLPAGMSLALAAWNKLQTCPSTITNAQATSVASGFEYAFECTKNAPESKIWGNGC
jgi:Protein of unknown function (DUF3105)